MEILNSVNTIYEKVILAVENEIYPLIDKTLSLVYQIISNEDLYCIFIKLNKVFNSLIFSILTIILFYKVMKKNIIIYSKNEEISILKEVFKLIILYIIATNSTIIIKTISDIFEIVYNYIITSFEDIVGEKLTFSSLLNEVDLKSMQNSDLFSLEGLTKSLVCYGSVNILIANCVRFIILFVIYSVLPIAIMSSGISGRIGNKLYIKVCKLIVVILLAPLIIKLLLVLPLSLKKVDPIYFNIALLGIFNIVSKIENYIKEMIY